MKIFITGLIIVLFCSFAYAGDVLYLKSGGVLEGKITVEDDYYTLEFKTGSMKVPKDKVEKVSLTIDSQIEYQKKLAEKKEKLLKEYEEKLSQTDQQNVQALINLADWCGTNHLEDKRKECLKKILTFDSENEFARKELGYVKYEGKWLTEDEYMPKKGYVKYNGKWITPEEMKKIKQLEEQKKRLKELEKKLQSMFNTMASSDKTKRHKAYEEVVEFGKKNNVKNIEPAAKKVLDYYDRMWNQFGTNVSEDSNVRLDIYNMTNAQFRLQQIITRVIYADPPAPATNQTVVIDVPVGQVVDYSGTVVVPGSK